MLQLLLWRVSHHKGEGVGGGRARLAISFLVLDAVLVESPHKRRNHAVRLKLDVLMVMLHVGSVSSKLVPRGRITHLFDSPSLLPALGGLGRVSRVGVVHVDEVGDGLWDRVEPQVIELNTHDTQIASLLVYLQ